MWAGGCEHAGLTCRNQRSKAYTVMACADDCFACLAALLEDGEIGRIASELLRGRSARSCPEGQRGPKNADVGKLQIVVSELHNLSSAAWQRLEKPAMTQATIRAGLGPKP